MARRVGSAYNELGAATEALGGRNVRPLVPSPGGDADAMFVWPDGALSFNVNCEDRDIEVFWSSRDPDQFKAMSSLVAEHVKPRVTSGKVYTVVMGREGPKLESIGLAGVPLIEGNYTPAVIEDFHHVVEDFQTDPPCGRVVIFNGSPGTGKSFALRALLHAVPDAVFVLIQPSMVQDLAGPSFIKALISAREAHRNTPTILVIEDADECLVHRDGANMGSISAVLNLGDGMLGSLFKIRIVATTNAGHLRADETLDEAILRPGRLCRLIHVGALPAKQAGEVYKRLTGETLKFDSDVTVAEVYRIARDKGWKPKAEKAPMGFSAPRVKFDITDEGYEVDTEDFFRS